MSPSTLLLSLLALLAGVALGVPQSSAPRWRVRSSFSGTPGYSGYYRGGSGTLLGERSGFNRFGGNTRLTSVNSFSGGSTLGSGSFSGSAFGSQFFRDQFRRIENSFPRGTASRTSTGSRTSTASRATSSDDDSD